MPGKASATAGRNGKAIEDEEQPPQNQPPGEEDPPEPEDAAGQRSERSDAAAMNVATSMRAQGFTLLEVLVAVVIFGIISLLAYGGYNQLIQQSDIVERNASARVRSSRPCSA